MARATALHTEARDHNRAPGSTRVPQLVAKWYADMALGKVSQAVTVCLNILGYFILKIMKKLAPQSFHFGEYVVCLVHRPVTDRFS